MQGVFRRLGFTALLCWKSTRPSTAFFVSCTNTGSAHRSPTTARQMASTSNTNETDRIIRVLALHGSEGTAEEFPNRLEALKSCLAGGHNVRLEITAVQAPFPKGDGFAWWEMKNGERSFTAKEYGGFDISARKVLEAWNANPPYDLVLGHSQGAILVAALITLQMIPSHPPLGYIFNGVSFPNPYRDQLAALKFTESSGRPRTLFVMGADDRIAPNEIGEELRDGFQNAGLDVDTIQHPGGHGVPNKADKDMEAIIDWILQ